MFEANSFYVYTAVRNNLLIKVWKQMPNKILFLRKSTADIHLMQVSVITHK